MVKWWDRVERLLEAQGMSAADLARESGIDPKLIYKYLEGKVENPRGDALKRMADALATSEQYLRYGNAPATVVELKRVPLIRLAALGALKRGQDPRMVWDGVLVVAVQQHIQDDAFAVVLTDDSNAPEYKSGEVIICEKTEPAPGRMVVAVMEAMKAAYIGRFRPLRVDNAKHFKLIPLNPNYPEIEINETNQGFVLARIIKHIRDVDS